jgi:hypothetical protein
VPDVFGRVDGLGHAAQGCGADKVLLGLALDICLSNFWISLALIFFLLVAKLVANRAHKGCELLDAVPLGSSWMRYKNTRFFLGHFSANFDT